MDFDETYRIVIRLQAIRMVLASSCIIFSFHKDVKSVSLKGYIQKELYVDHPLVFKNFLSYFFKMKKALYDLK